MMKKPIYYLAAAVMVIALAACSSPTATTAAPASSNTGGAIDPTAAAAATLENRLAPGILALEGTAQAITADQAKQLLPLWQQVQTLDNTGTAATSDYQTVYQQIEGILTSDQTSAIIAMSMNQTDLQTLMTTYGISVTPGAGGIGGGGFGGATLSADQQATRTAERTLTAGTPGRGFNGTGTPGANGGRFFSGTGTPGAGGQFRGGRNMNTIFVGSLVQLLQTRAGA